MSSLISIIMLPFTLISGLFGGVTGLFGKVMELFGMGEGLMGMLHLGGGSGQQGQGGGGNMFATILSMVPGLGWLGNLLGGSSSDHQQSQDSDRHWYSGILDSLSQMGDRATASIKNGYNSVIGTISSFGSHTSVTQLDAAQIKAESNGDTNAVSRAGAEGLMQLMPGTASDMAKAKGVAYVPTAVKPNGAYNVTLGHEKQQLMLNRYKKYTNFSENDQFDMAMAGYNWGESHVDDAIKTYGHNWKDHIPAETRAYIANVRKALNNIQSGHTQLNIASRDTNFTPLAGPGQDNPDQSRSVS